MIGKECPIWNGSCFLCWPRAWYFRRPSWAWNQPGPGRFVQQMPGPDVHRFGRQVHRLRRSDRQRRPQLCPKCSAKRHQCEHCLAATTEKDEAAAQSKPADPAAGTSRTAMQRCSAGQAAPGLDRAGRQRQSCQAGRSSAAPSRRVPKSTRRRRPRKRTRPTPPENLPESKPPAELPPDPAAPVRLKPINPAKAGTYTSGKWRYQMQITSPGTRSEGRWGWLTYDGQKLPRGDVNDYYNTPWGPMYWVDVPTTAWGVHGWMPVPLAQNRRQGRALRAARRRRRPRPPPPTPRGPPRRQARGCRCWKSTSRTTASWPGCGSAMFS